MCSTQPREAVVTPQERRTRIVRAIAAYEQRQRRGRGRKLGVIDRLRRGGLIGLVLQDLLGLDALPQPGASVRCPRRDSHKNGDARPSFVVGRTGEGGMCFACGLAGGLLDLVRQLKGLPDRAAAARWIERRYVP